MKNEQSINPLLGDASFVHTFGHAPSANADEDVRIATHLAYIEQLLRDADWVAASGLTKWECAMIQPQYGTIPVDVNRNYVSKSYGISSAVFSGVNLSIGAINIVQLSQGAESKVMPLVGLATGVAQATMGIIEFPKDEEPRWGDQPAANIGKRNVSLLNIGLGTANVLLSSWNLIANKPRNERLLTWDIGQTTMPNNQIGLGFQVTRKF